MRPERITHGPWIGLDQRRADYLSQPEPIDYGVVVDVPAMEQARRRRAARATV